MEGRSRRNNIRVEGISRSENEAWDEEKVRKVVKEHIERAHRVKRNNDDNCNNDRKLLHFKDKQDILHKTNSRKVRKFYFKEDFSRETLKIRKSTLE